MFNSIRSRIAVSVLIIVIAAVVVTIAAGYVGGGKASSKNNEDYKRIITYTPTYSADDKITYAFSYAKIQDIASNSAVRFLNPFGKAMSTLSQDSVYNNSMTDDERTALVKDADSFEHYILIRLSPELGGNLENVNAFRAYSDLDPGSKCLLGYRSDSEIGAVLQDPCHSDVFRVSDGYSCFGRIISTNPILSGYNAIPRLRLSLDDQGYLLAARPDGQPSGDGTVGEGRIVSDEEIKAYEADPSCDIIKP